MVLPTTEAVMPERDHQLATTPARTGAEKESRKKRSRSFWTLLREFWGLLQGRRRYLMIGVGTVTVFEPSRMS